MTATTAIEQAAWVYARSSDYDKQQRFDAATELGEWGIFSSRQISAITGVGHSTALKLSPKSAKTGGRFSPECLAPLLDISRRKARGEQIKTAEVSDMLAAGNGTSTYMAARLGGISESWLRRRKGERDEHATPNSDARLPVADLA